MFDVTIYGKTFCEKNVKAAKRRSDSNGIAAKRSGKLPRRSDSHADKRRGKLLGYTLNLFLLLNSLWKFLIITIL